MSGQSMQIEVCVSYWALGGRVNVRVIEAVKKFLIKAWSVRKSGHNGNWDGRGLV